MTIVFIMFLAALFGLVADGHHRAVCRSEAQLREKLSGAEHDTVRALLKESGRRV